MYRLLTKMLDAERSGKTMLSACNLPKDEEYCLRCKKQTVLR